jgi:hypothetical protein
MGELLEQFSTLFPIERCLTDNLLDLYNQSALHKAFLTIQGQALIDEAKKVAPSERQLFTSNHDYRDAVRRHSCTESKDMSMSLTSNQSYGWKRGNDAYDLIPHKIRGKKSCPETLYCNEFIKSGLTY